MKLHYVTRLDKNNNNLTTSYDNHAKAVKYGSGTEQKHWVGVRYFKDGVMSGENSGLIVRSHFQGANHDFGSGRFVIYAQNDSGEFEETYHRFETYGLANSAMKNMAAVYPEMLVVEEPETQEADEEVPLSDPNDLPF